MAEARDVFDTMSEEGVEVEEKESLEDVAGRVGLLEIMLEEAIKEVRQTKKNTDEEIEKLKKEIEDLKETGKSERTENTNDNIGEQEKAKKNTEVDKKADEAAEDDDIEKAERERRRKNVVIKGVGGTKKWKEEVKKIVYEAAGKAIQIEKEWECGGKDLSVEKGTAILELWSEEEKKLVMRGRTKVEIRYDVAIEDDMSFKERERRWRMRAKIAEERYKRNCAMREAAEREKNKVSAKKAEEGKQEEEKGNKEEKATAAKKEGEKQKIGKEKGIKKKEIINKLAEMLRALKDEEEDDENDEQEGQEGE